MEQETQSRHIVAGRLETYRRWLEHGRFDDLLWATTARPWIVEIVGAHADLWHTKDLMEQLVICLGRGTPWRRPRAKMLIAEIEDVWSKSDLPERAPRPADWPQDLE